MTKYPPLQYVFFEFEQLTDSAWLEFEKLVSTWNKTEYYKFESEQEGEWFITFENGIKDADLKKFQDTVQALNERTGLVWFVGIKDERRPEEFEKSPFIDVIGDGYPDGFIANESIAFGIPEKCPECGNGGDNFKKILQPLIIDETLIGKSSNEFGEATSWNPDLVTIPNGGLLISKKVLMIFNKNKIKGYELFDVLSKQSMSPTEDLFLIRANKSILEPCSEHTMITESGVCKTCGRILGGLLTHYSIRQQSLEGVQIFSRHPYRYARICITNGLYWLLKDSDIQGMLPSYGFYQCDHV